MAASASLEIMPPYQVSTTLNIVLKKKPVPAGMARPFTRSGYRLSGQIENTIFDYMRDRTAIGVL